MELKLINNIDKIYDLEVVFCFSNEDQDKYSDMLKKLYDDNYFKCKCKTSFNTTIIEDGKLKKLVFIGLGEKDKLSYYSLYESIISGIGDLTKYKNILINTFECDNITLDNVVKCIVLSLGGNLYEFNKYMSKKREKSFENNIDIFVTNNNINIQEFIDIRDAINLTRDLVNEPANVLTPHELGERCKESVKDLDVEIDVYDENWIKENNLHALYSVGKASVNKPRFIVMKYFGDKDSNKSISFVGKGLTYDSGGYSIKSSNGMVTMKCDMAGAASVLSLITLVAKQKLKVNIYGVIPACENMINGDGFKPGDIIESLGGKTIEIISTDAEGRLALADGVYYAADKLNTDVIIDIATLTGACGIALGTKYAAVIDNSEEMFNLLNKASENTVESIWRLPGDKDYLKLIKSSVADYKNIGGRYGGTITAGLFVGEFVKNKPWAHIDIAYVAWNDSSTSIFPKVGATGASVELLYNLCKNNQL